MSPNRTRRFLRTTLLMRILASSHVSSASTMHTVSLRFFPCDGGVHMECDASSSVPPTTTFAVHTVTTIINNTNAHYHHIITNKKFLGGGHVMPQSPELHSQLYLEQHCIATKELQLLHGLQVESNHRVVVVHCFIHDQPVWRLLALQDGRAKVLALAPVDE